MSGMIGHVDAEHNNVSGEVTDQVLEVPLEVSLASKTKEKVQEICHGPKGEGLGSELAWVWHGGAEARPEALVCRA